ncbi:hypothetical protein [Photobacterium sp. 1_MG-2023]|uniref:hypothetical protein n=1 Tax=Photobacterium sp. 1_MG-2023 TaxID=3062646 RepID=UPI0026E22991|nr:hypothetical protein [Photobacterium sp. 1_MG-2023]MDO6706738.1 hypothetical protein [Photobacterium sp. 1_MG-2023]
MIKTNPYSEQDTHRAEIWDMLVTRDIQAYCDADWTQVAEDFIEQEFYAVNANNSQDPAQWTFAFSTLADYREEWLKQALAAQNTAYSEPLKTAVHRATTLNEITIENGRAIARKQFCGTIQRADGQADELLWQSIYYLKHTTSGWKICGFTGYLPYTA